MANIEAKPKKIVLPKFTFVCEAPNTLTIERAHETIQGVLAVDENAQHCTKFAAFVEDDGSPPDSGKPLKKWEYKLPGVLRRFSIEKPQAVLKTKRFDALEHLRFKGHQSTHAKEYLTTDTLVMVIGSPEYLARNAILYFEDEGPLYAELVELMYMMIGLSERKKRAPATTTYFHYQVKNKKFYGGNFDALLAAVSMDAPLIIGNEDIGSFLDAQRGKRR